MDAVINKEKYKSDKVLRRGANFFHKNADFLTTFAQYTDYCTPGQKVTPHLLDCLYTTEVLGLARSGSYMDIWQYRQVANALNVIVEGVYAHRNYTNTQKDHTRIFYPLDRDEGPVELVIMFTPMTFGDNPNHFVPMLKDITYQ